MNTQKCLITGSIIAVSLLPLAGFAKIIKPPNILFIMTDQQSAGMMSCAGNRYLKTPALDALAASGMRFEKAYSPNPVCVPARTAIMTGRFPSAFGFSSNEDAKKVVIPPQVLDHTMGKVLQRAGYRAVYGGKTHWAGNLKNLKTSGFEFLTTDPRDELATKCADFLHGKHNQPFFLVASFMNPHDICYVAGDAYTKHYGLPLKSEKEATEDRANIAAAIRLADKAKQEGVYATLCPPLKKNFGSLPDQNEVDRNAIPPARAGKTKATDNYGSMQTFIQAQWKEADWRLHSWIYHRLTEDADRQIGIVLNALHESGLDQNTIVIFTSDHGEMDGSHGLVHKSHFYDESARVPFLISGPGVARGVDREHLISTVDLLPTFCDFAGIAAPEGLQGRSLKPLALGTPTPDVNKFIVSENGLGRMVRTARYKYCLYKGGDSRETLFDMDADPGEMNNLAGAPRSERILKEHRALLQDWVKKNR